MAKIVILGAGLTGLSTAYHLEKNNFFDFTIFEKEATYGGLCRSVTHDGFTFDFTGHLLHCNNDYFYTLLNQTLPHHTRNTHTRNSYIFTYDRFVPYPFQMNLYGLPTQVITECLCSFAKRNHQLDPQNFYEWVLKYFGTGFAKYFFVPYHQKLLQYNLKKIHPSWTGRFVPKTTFKDLLAGLSSNATKQVGYNHQFYYPKQGGIQTFTDNLRKQIISPINISHKAMQIDLKKKVVSFENGHTEPFEILITTIPLNVFLQRIKQPASLAIKNNHTKLQCNSVINFNLGWKGPIACEHKHWIYFPEKKYSFYRVGFWHNFSKALVLPGHQALYGEFSYRPEQIDKKELDSRITQSITQICQVLGIAKSLVTQKILYLPHAYVIYDQWREKNLPLLHQALHDQSVYSIGRYGAWNYSSMQDAILDGQKIAAKLLHQFIPAQMYKKKEKTKPQIKLQKQVQGGK